MKSWTETKTESDMIGF